MRPQYPKSTRPYHSLEVISIAGLSLLPEPPLIGHFSGETLSFLPLHVPEKKLLGQVAHDFNGPDGVPVTRLVGWSLTSLFSSYTAISETKGQG